MNIFFTKESDKKSDEKTKPRHVIGTYETFDGAVPYVPCFAEWPSDGH